MAKYRRRKVGIAKILPSVRKRVKQTEFRQKYLEYKEQQRAKKVRPQDIYTFGEWKRLKQAGGSRQYKRSLETMPVREYRGIYRKFLK